MKLVKFLAYLFYRYFSESGPRRDIPYFCTLLSLTLLFYLHLLQISILLTRMGIIPINNADGRTVRFGKMALIMLPIFLVFLALIRKSKLKLMRYEERRVKKAYVFLLVYILLSVTLTIIMVKFI
jgi:hypothetical protein